MQRNVDPMARPPGAVYLQAARAFLNGGDIGTWYSDIKVPQGKLVEIAEAFRAQDLSEPDTVCMLTPVSLLATLGAHLATEAVKLKLGEAIRALNWVYAEQA